MTLNVMTPRTGKQSYEVGKVFLPGSEGAFEVLQNHAAMVASLGKGDVRWSDIDGSEKTFSISSGVVCIKNNVIDVVAQN